MTYPLLLTHLTQDSLLPQTLAPHASAGGTQRKNSKDSVISPESYRDDVWRACVTSIFNIRKATSGIEVVNA